MVGILNCHPNIMVLFEIYKNSLKSSKRDKCFIKYNDEIGTILKSNAKLLCVYNSLEQYFSKRMPYTYFGGKLPSIDKDFIYQFKDEKVIYMIRDISSWVSKQAIDSAFGVRKNRKKLQKAILDYLYCFILSFTFSDCLCIRMEDFITNNNKVLHDISEFLSVDGKHFDNWWDKIGKWDDDQKQIDKWWLGHPSSLKKPTGLDTHVQIYNNKLWEAVFPLFNKYYNFQYNFEDVANDLRVVDSIRNESFDVGYKDMFLI